MTNDWPIGLGLTEVELSALTTLVNSKVKALRADFDAGRSQGIRLRQMEDVLERMRETANAHEAKQG